MHSLQTAADRRRFLLNLTAFAACIEGLFFFGAFAYVYFLRSRGLLPGLAAGTNWVFRDESAHMAFAFEVLRHGAAGAAGAVRCGMGGERARDDGAAVECESPFADDVLSGGVIGMTRSDMRQYLEYVADQRLVQLELRAAVRLTQSVPLHGAAGRAGADQLLRAPRLGLPDGGPGRSGLRSGVLNG